jgi:N-acetylmuramoyl-L-alanine amidase
MKRLVSAPTHIIVHHTQMLSWFAHDVDTVRGWHRNNGWDDIGYHHYIRRSGQHQLGRSEEYQGAHCADGGMNTRSIGVCLEGHFDYQTPTRTQLLTLINLIANICERYAILPESVIGHREAGSKKSCPGRRMNMTAIRERLRITLTTEKHRATPINHKLVRSCSND